MKVRVGIGQDSHRFLSEEGIKPCILGGVLFEGVNGLMANSDGDVVLHALCNAISSLTHELILGKKADELLENEGITDSTVYLQEARKTLKKQKISHVAISIEASRPKILPKREQMRKKIAELMEIEVSAVGITATTGEGLTSVGSGEGVSVFCVITTWEQ